MDNGAVSPAVTRQVREANRSPPSGAEIKHGGAIPLLPHACLYGVVLI
jgi:hypothetical protein